MPEDLRVTFLVTNYPADGIPVRGAFHRTLAEALVRAGAKVEVVAPVPQAPWPLKGVNRRWAGYSQIPERYDLGGIAVCRPRYWQVPQGSLFGVGHRGFARCLSRSLALPPDVIHAHFAYPCGLAAEIAAARWGVPVVLTLHGSDVNVLPEKSRRVMRLFSTAVRKATFVTTVSNALAERTQVLTGRRPAVMPIGIDLRLYRDLPQKTEARERIGLPVEAGVVLFIGGLWEAKGVLVLCDAIQRIGRRGLLGVFVGDGPLRASISGRSGIMSVGAVPHERVALFLRAADVLVLPSFSEGMPTVIVEAGAVGVPVVASAVGGIGEILGDDRGLLVPAGDVDRLVAGIECVLADRNAAAERADRLREYVARHYDVDQNARATLTTYESLL